MRECTEERRKAKEKATKGCERKANNVNGANSVNGPQHRTQRAKARARAGAKSRATTAKANEAREWRFDSHRGVSLLVIIHLSNRSVVTI